MKSITLIFTARIGSALAGIALLVAISSCCSKTVIVSTYAGSGASGNADGTGSSATFAQPVDVGVDGKGNVYVADKGNNSVRIIKTNKAVSLFYYWAGRPSGGFLPIRNLDVDKNGKVFVADYDNLSLRRIEGGLAPTVTGFRRDDTFYYEYRSVDGHPDSASFYEMVDFTLNKHDDLLYVIDDTPAPVLLRRVTLPGIVTTLTGYPTGNSITIDGYDNIYLSQGSKVIKVTPAGDVSDFAGASTPGYADGMGTAARFNGITSIDADDKGNVYVSDNGNHRVRKISDKGEVTTLAGNGTAGFADGPGAVAQFNDLQGIVVSKCVVYVADRANNRIRRITVPR